MNDGFNFDNLIFKFLQKYFIEKINNNKNIGDKFNDVFAFSNKLLDNGRITDDELDEILANNNQLIDYVISIISNCPYININLHN